jgi:DNA invertase Pin-like site-specific DNA recombinase
MTTVFSYVRFSSPSQAGGDSLRRQIDWTVRLCERRGWTLDTSLTLHDLGVSAFRGKNAAVGHLRTFLDAIEFGRVLPGSVLCVENIDRISRQGIDEGYDLCKRILKADVRIVTLSPEREYDRDSVRKLANGALELQLYLERAAEESERKSIRLSEAWGQKKQVARKERSVQTTRVPAWLEVVGRERIGKHIQGGTFHVLAERAAIVREIFSLACYGHGLALIVNHLTAAGVPTWGRGAKWSKAYVHKILTGRSVLGEYQPRKNGKPEGPAIPDYYPAIIDSGTWYKAQKALQDRKDKPGRISAKTVSLFSGLLWDARTGERMLVASQTQGSGAKRRRKVRVLVPAGSMEGRERSITFNYAIFETAILSLLREVDPAEVLGAEVVSEAAGLELELAAISERRQKIVARLVEGGEVPELEEAARLLRQRESEVRKQLAAARQTEANPQGAAWQEAQSLLDMAADESTQLRLRGLLRAIIAEIRILICPRGRDRLCAVQVWFAEGKGHRSYLILSRAAGYCREGGWLARSLADIANPSELDLRRSEDAAALEEVLAELDLAELEKGEGL